MFTRIPGNPQEDSGECYHFNILENGRKDSGMFFQDSFEFFLKIPGNVIKDSGKYYYRFQEIILKTPENVTKDSGNFQGDSGEFY